MSDESPDNEESSEEPIGGARLRKVRRENDISVRDIAKELHLDEAKVRALETNNFDQLGAPVFAKGHMRKYAELVGVADADILDDYYQLNRSAGAPPVVSPKRRQPIDYSFLPALTAGVILALLLSAALYWWFNREAPVDIADELAPSTLAPFAGSSEESSEPAETTIPETGDDSQSGEEEVAASVEEETADVDPVEAVDIDVEPVVVEEAPIVSNLPQVSVTMTFSGDCWTEASDASDRRLFYDLGTAGRVVSISGDAPLRIVFGDGDNVRLQVEGRDYPIPDSARSGRLARLTIQRP